MIYANIDNLIDKKIVGFECGTRAGFDERHPNDPLWIFLDADIIRSRISVSNFLWTPTMYYFDNTGNIRRQLNAPNPNQVG